jgi:predicted secreted protein
MQASQIEERVQALHRQLGIVTTRPIDVFNVIRSLGIFLQFRPLDKLYGAFLSPSDGTFGILLHSKHPLSLRRFTAGHELGHFILDHGPDTDTKDEINEGSNYSKLEPQEKEANMFAAAFLMPRNLLVHTARGLGVDLEDKAAVLSEAQALSLSTHTGTSYQATITRLRVLGFISADWPRRNTHKPLEIKAAMGGYKPDVFADTGAKLTWNDVVVVDEASANGSVIISHGQVLEVALQNKYTSGYAWEITDVPEGVRIETVTRSLSSDNRLGAGTAVTFSLFGLSPATNILCFIKRRPWEPEVVLQRCDIRVVVEPQAGGVDLSQLVA